MGQALAIKNKLIKEFLRKKKETALLFFLANIIIIIVIPYLFNKKSVSFQLYSIEIFNLVLLRQWTAESFASERENKTFESLISSGVNIETLFYSETVFYFLSTIVIKYALLLIFTCTYYLFNHGINLGVDDFLLMVFIDITVKIYMAFKISWISMLSKTVNEANVRSSKYMILFTLLIYVLINMKFTMNQGLLIFYSIVLILFIFLNIFFSIKVNKIMNKNNIYEIV